MVSLSSDTRVLSGDQLLCWNRIPCEDPRPFGDSSRSEVHAQWTVRAQDTQPLVSRSDTTLPSTCPVHPLAFRTTSSLLCRQPCQPPFPRPRRNHDRCSRYSRQWSGCFTQRWRAGFNADDAWQGVQSQDLSEVVSCLFATRFQPIEHGPSRHQPSTLRCGRDMQVYAVSQQCPKRAASHRICEWNRIASIRHCFSGRSVSALRGLHQQSPVSDVHVRSVLQRSQVVPLRNLGFQEPVATARQQACPGALGSLSLPEVFPADFEFVRHLAQCLCRTPTFSQRLRGTIGTIQRSNAPTFGETTGSLANGEIEDMISENREHFAKCSPFQSLMWSCSMWFASCVWDKLG